MFTYIVIVAVLAVVYGMAWHNEPAKPQTDRPRARQNGQ
jgi:hypothetical protein